MTKINLNTKLSPGLQLVFSYLNEYKLIYAGVIICNLCCFNFHTIFKDRSESGPLSITLVLFFFTVSFISPIILGLIFAAKSFVAKTRRHLLGNIIHAYIGTILIFSALYYQCSVLGDFNDAVNKQGYYEAQVNIKKLDPDFIIMRVTDRRAFKGIKARIWSGYDYPDDGLLYSPTRNPDSWHSFTTNGYEELSIEQIERIVNNKTEYSKVIQYQKQNVIDVYIDCLYFSVICIATVGFGDISPNLWYSKLFTAFEVFIGISIFVFALGILFSNWTVNERNNFDT